MNLKRDHAMQEQASSSEWADKCQRVKNKMESGKMKDEPIVNLQN